MMNMDFVRKLPVPKDIKEQYPISDEMKAVKAEKDKTIADVFTGKSGKFILVIGIERPSYWKNKNVVRPG